MSPINYIPLAKCFQNAQKGAEPTILIITFDCMLSAAWKSKGFEHTIVCHAGQTKSPSRH